MPADTNASERSLHLSHFKRIREEWHVQFAGCRDEWLELLEQKISHPEFPTDSIRIINILVEVHSIFSVRIIEFTLNHDVPDRVVDAISILINSERGSLLNALIDVFKNPDPVSTARCGSLLSQRNLLEGRQQKLITHVNTLALYRDALHVMEMVNFPIERYVDKLLDDLEHYDLEEYTQETSKC
jgi:hypothetical protein